MRSEALCLAQENHVIVKLNSNGFSCIKNYSENKIELQNPQMLKKMLKKAVFVITAAL